MNTLLQAIDLGVEIEGKPILSHIHLNIQQGEFLALTGSNGSGKSTLLQCLGRLRIPSQGQVLWQGKRIHSISPRHLSRKLAILTQHHCAPADITVKQLVHMGRTPYERFPGIQDSHAEEAVHEALAITHLEPLCSRTYGTLSGGEQQRVWIAMMIAQNPDVFLLDEPTTFLDIEHQLEILNILKQWNRLRNKTIVAIIHDLNHALRFADRIAVIHTGRLIALDASHEAFDPTILKSAFGVEADILHDTRHQCRFLVTHLPQKDKKSPRDKHDPILSH